MEDRFQFWWRWLVTASCAVMFFGLSMVIFPGPTQRLFNFMYLSSPDGTAKFGQEAINYIAFVTAVLGAVMFAWSITFLFVLFGTFRRKQPEGWRTLVVSLVAWYIPDTTFSLWSGFWQNAVLNAVMLAIFAIPLASIHREFRATPKQAL